MLPLTKGMCVVGATTAVATDTHQKAEQKCALGVDALHLIDALRPGKSDPGWDRCKGQAADGWVDGMVDDKKYKVTPAIGCTPVAQEIPFLLISARMRPPIGCTGCSDH
ncbi:hypothetical protein HaLaN_01738, partial [Haematococcus lacustris]